MINKYIIKLYISKINDDNESLKNQINKGNNLMKNENKRLKININ